MMTGIYSAPAVAPQFAGRREDKKVRAMRNRLNMLRTGGEPRPQTEAQKQELFRQYARDVRVQKVMKEDLAAPVNKVIDGRYKTIEGYLELLEHRGAMGITARDEELIRAEVAHQEDLIAYDEKVKQDLIPGVEKYNPDEKFMERLKAFRPARSSSGRTEIRDAGLMLAYGGAVAGALSAGIMVLPVAVGYIALSQTHKSVSRHRLNDRRKEGYRQEVEIAYQAQIEQGVASGRYPKGTTVSVEILKMSKEERADRAAGRLPGVMVIDLAAKTDEAVTSDVQLTTAVLTTLLNKKKERLVVRILPPGG